ncbi:hypothetical protein IJ750_02420 [bacterium]|nr:hypothetical protein [bacterium]
MVQVSRLFGIGNSVRRTTPRSVQPRQNPPTVINAESGCDTVNFSRNKTQSWEDIAQEWREYTSSIWGKPEPKFKNREAREQYWITYYDNYIRYCDKILNCANLPSDVKSEWEHMKNSALFDRNYHYRDLSNWKKENNIKTESYNDVSNEMVKNVPDGASTVQEKNVAKSYIERMLSCDDIPSDLKTYWTNKKNVIDMEIRAMLNQQQINTNENWKDVANEFDEFSQIYWVENVLKGNAGLDKLAYNDAQMYYYTATVSMLTYCNRILSCHDLPQNEQKYYKDLKMMFQTNLNLYHTVSNNNKRYENIKTESFNDVLEEMRANVPDSTKTLSEKRLAISYIERMLSCDDIPNPEYWQNKMDIIEQEIKDIENQQNNR